MSDGIDILKITADKQEYTDTDYAIRFRPTHLGQNAENEAASALEGTSHRQARN